ncbi:hypothetical protein HHK36_000965 [Tetracentron sinense]|uniref:Uncharacterized protein n=1 Tax=Tetracentron sinense TaxID=13715 RepID=A0A835DQI7_TETSI|nr:hypothetical protein HHK36_000965 [Tetracentron sinense]
MAFLALPPSSIVNITVLQVHLRSLGSWKASGPLQGFISPHPRIKQFPICCNKLSSWEPSPVTYAPTDDSDGSLLKGSNNIFESMNTEEIAEAPVTDSRDEVIDTSNRSSMQFKLIKWPMWLLGPSVLLATGMAPTLWLPLSSIFLGANIASLLSLVGLDCIFNIGATLFLLMADACARSKNLTQTCSSQAPVRYRFWNMIASIMGFLIPLTMFLISHKGFLQPQLSFISFAVLLGPYLLLLSIQMLTEMLTWHWESPVWLVTPIVYEAYRVLQLMRGLKLGAEIVAPAWMMHTIRGMVSWWVLILGMQLMRVAWFAGFTAQARQES